jgi:plasmid stabilization system protein ParE
VTRFEVVVAPTAQTHARQVSDWWSAERLGAPDLFDEELEAALERLATAPMSGAAYHESRGRVVRRLLMPRTSYHVYFEVDQNAFVVRVLAVWHTSRGRGPSL